MIDTHCHIHDDEYPLDADQVLKAAAAEGIDGVICVGTDALFSKQAIDFANRHENVWASVGLHPHDAKRNEDIAEISRLATDENVVAVGECGLDYYYDNSPREEQKGVLKQHFEIAKEHNLPMIFHIRGKENDSQDAYTDFWEIYDQYKLPGVVHSFSAHNQQLAQIVERDLLVGINGIATFLKPGEQLDAVREIPLEKLLLETDSPLLTPVPFRGQINEPKNIIAIAKFIATLKSQSVEEIAKKTDENSRKLFDLS